MAGSALGNLVASIVLNTAEFTAGTDRARVAAASMASDIDRSFSQIESKVKGSIGAIGAAELRAP